MATSRRSMAEVFPDLASAPVREGPVREEFEAIASECRCFSKALHAYVASLPEERGDAQVAAFVRASGRQFRKWNLEILHLLATHRTLRFNGLARRLPGISSRTLSARLTGLQKDGFVRREVGEGRPPRVTYALTPDGYRFAQLLAPVVVYLTLRAAES